MPVPEDFFARELKQLESTGLLRALRRQELPDTARAAIDGHAAVLFSGNDYLGLSDHPEVIEAGVRAMRRYGASATASRLISGNHPLYREFEDELAAFKGAQAALVFSSGYLANLGCLTAVAGSGDTVFMDRLCHASLYDAQRLAGSRLRRYRHNDLAHLRKLLELHAGEEHSGRRLIVTDGVFSMDGDVAPMAGLRSLADEFGCQLLVDDAHGTGVLGPSGKGTGALFGTAADLEIGTMSKALASLGGFVTGDAETIQYIINKARTFIFTTGLPPAAVAAAGAALKIFEAEGWRRERVLEISARATGVLASAGFVMSDAGAELCTPIIPLVTGTETSALELSRLCLDRGFFIPAVRTPAVPRNQARLRMTLSAAHSDEDLSRALEVLCASAAELGII